MSPLPAGPSAANLQIQLSQLKGRFSPRQWIWLLSGLLLLGTLGIGWIGIQIPWQTKRWQLEQEYQQEVQRSKFISEILRTQQDLKALEASFLFPGGPPALTQEISSIATRSGIKIESILPKPTVHWGPYRQLQIELAGAASFESLILFLHNVERHEPFLHIDHLEIGDSQVGMLEGTPQPFVRPRRSAPQPPRPIETGEEKIHLLVSSFDRVGSTTP